MLGTLYNVHDQSMSYSKIWLDSTFLDLTVSYKNASRIMALGTKSVSALLSSKAINAASAKLVGLYMKLCI